MKQLILKTSMVIGVWRFGPDSSVRFIRALGVSLFLVWPHQGQFSVTKHGKVTLMLWFWQSIHISCPADEVDIVDEAHAEKVILRSGLRRAPGFSRTIWDHISMHVVCLPVTYRQGATCRNSQRTGLTWGGDTAVSSRHNLEETGVRHYFKQRKAKVELIFTCGICTKKAESKMNAYNFGF